MTAKVVFQKYKVNIIFHCLQDRVRTSEFSTDHALFGCCFRFPISTPHPVFQADEVLTVLCSTFIFNGSGPFPTVPTVWNVLTPTYHLPGNSFLSFKVTLGVILSSSNQLLLFVPLLSPFSFLVHLYILAALTQLRATSR